MKRKLDNQDNRSRKRQQQEVIVPTVVKASAEWEENTASNVIDNDFSTRWNAGHLSGWDVPNYIVFDFGQKVRINRFQFRGPGDRIHDVKEFLLQVSDTPDGGWSTVAADFGKNGCAATQSFMVSGVSQYWRWFIKSRYTRYQAYVYDVGFDTSLDLGRIPELTSVEREFLRRSGRKDGYPNESVAVIETSNVAEMGQLTALSFIEWVKENPEGVIALPTGKTPEMLIKWLRFYRENWDKPGTRQTLRDFGLTLGDSEPFPATSNLKFVQLDEFFPISATQKNSFLNYVREYYVKTLDLKEENLNLIDYSKFDIFQEHSMDEIFPTGKCDLELRNREPNTELETLQKRAILEADKFCAEYEARVKELGGIGFFLGGIGYDGHIAFNFAGCDPTLPTRLVTLNYQTAAQSAGEFGGIQHTRGKCAITIGLSTITMNKDNRIVIMAAGEAKAKVIMEAIMLSKNHERPASVLQGRHGARFYLTPGSSMLLSDRRLEDLKKQCMQKSVKQEDLFQTVCDLALQVEKQILHLTAEHFVSNPKAKHVYTYWVKQRLPLSSLLKKVHDFLILSLDRGLSLPAGENILHTSPHHDDIMLAYHEITNFLFKHNQNYIAYITSGFNSVSDTYVTEVLGRVDFSIKRDIDSIVDPAMTWDYSRILEIFRQGYMQSNYSQIEHAETILVLQRVREVWDCKNADDLQKRVSTLLQEYFPNKHLGQHDSEKVKIFKGAIRESECDRMWALQNIPTSDIFHTRSKFYTGDFFNPMPTIKEDAVPMLDLYKKTMPDILSVAFDPEGTGPDTHYKVLQVVAQGLRLAQEQNLEIQPRIWGYRNVWYRFKVAAANVAIPVRAAAMDEMHKTFLASFGCQKKAEFPSPAYDGPFSVLSQRFHIQQLREFKILLGKDFFRNHHNKEMRMADGIILLKEMDVNEFLSHAADLRSKIEIHKLL